MNYYCLNIEFSNIELGKEWLVGETTSSIHHAHLSFPDGRIELKIYYDSKTYFGERLSNWVSKLDWNEFGIYMKVSGESQNHGIKKIDFQGAKLIKLVNGSAQFEGLNKYVLLELSLAKIYRDSIPKLCNTAELILDDAGFSMVQEFYGIMYGFDGNFRINRMEGVETFYKLRNAEFRPEFDFGFSDKRTSKIATINKVPFIKFVFKRSVSEIEAIKLSDIVCSLASFYYGIKIGYSTFRIYAPEYFLTVVKQKDESIFKTKGNLSGFGIDLSFHELLEASWQKHFYPNFDKLKKIINLFNQAAIVDTSSEFLIRYNILEICNDGKIEFHEYTPVVSPMERKKLFKFALDKLLLMIDEVDHKEFTEKWNTLSGKLIRKPMKSTLRTFLLKQKIPLDLMTISIDEIKRIRDKITHGSIKSISPIKLRKCNQILYRLNGILILNILKVKGWELMVN